MTLAETIATIACFRCMEAIIGPLIDLAFRRRPAPEGAARAHARAFLLRRNMPR